MISSLLSRCVILMLGTLYPAYASYKAVRTKDVKEYVKWMMYWIVFALFTTAETVTDVLLSFWFPFYYELKIVVVLWLLSPATQGSSILYRKLVHPVLVRREHEIDECLARATEQGYKTVVELGAKGVQYATQVIMTTAIKGGGGLVNQLKKSYSVGDLPERTSVASSSSVDRRRGVVVLQALDENDSGGGGGGGGGVHITPLPDVSDSEVDDFNEPVAEVVQMRPPAHRAPRARRIIASQVHFGEIDGARSQPVVDRDSSYIGQVQSVEDISSGYSSTELLLQVNDAAAAALGAVPRRTGSVRVGRSGSRPVTIEGMPSPGPTTATTGTRNRLASDPEMDALKWRPIKKKAPPPPPTALQTPNRRPG